MLRKKLPRWLPSKDALRQKRALRWLGPLLRRPWLWQLGRRRVATGAAIGVFFGCLIPVLQIGFAALLAVLLRANLPVAAVSTLLSNPLTYAPIAVLAYRTGAQVLGERVDAAKVAALAELGGQALPEANDWTEQAMALGKPLLVGQAGFAAIGATVAWVAVNLLWTLAVRTRRWRGTRRSVPLSQ